MVQRVDSQRAEELSFREPSLALTPLKNEGFPEENELFSFPLVRERTERVPYKFAKKHSLLPIAEEAEKIIVAMSNPSDLEALEEVRLMLGKEAISYSVSQALLEKVIEQCYRQKEGVTSAMFARLSEEQDALFPDEEEYDLLEQSEDSPVIRMVNVILLEAIQQESSDIHFEPLEEGVEVRYRIDGALQKRHMIRRDYVGQVISRVKVMAKLDIAEHRLPQDGRIKLRLYGRQIDFRVSSIPVVAGERIVLRILDRQNILLDKLGIPEETLELFQRLIRQSEGIVLVTGPTGSGKTTTLYSAISEIRSPEMNIMTIEDPVEYKVPGIAQMGVNPKIDLSFAKGLRHILRQDPDVIMIGEIRDRETAEIAIQSALTGHLVLSTLHTNDAPSALTRLVDMGVPAYLLSSSVIGILAQRLVRRICPHCKVPYHPSALEMRQLDLEFSDLKQASFSRGKGCEHCFGLGFRGRVGIYELMAVTPAIRAQLLKSADGGTLKEIAFEEGMEGLRRAGARLVVAGLTTFCEVMRVASSLEG